MSNCTWINHENYCEIINYKTACLRNQRWRSIHVPNCWCCRNVFVNAGKIRTLPRVLVKCFKVTLKLNEVINMRIQSVEAGDVVIADCLVECG